MPHWRMSDVACVFFDLSKAFDTLPHSLIMNSLARVGGCGELYHWFANYLSERRQRVVLDGACSSTLGVTSGVPQGSILGPLLFILSVDPNPAFYLAGCIAENVRGRHHLIQTNL